MKVIISHVNTDFDALASMIAAHKLYPDAIIAITDKLAVSVKQFLAIYREKLDLIPTHQINWHEVRELIIVDVASLAKLGDFTDHLQLDNLKITVFDHHPPQAGNVKADEQTIEAVGATVTLLVEKIRQRALPITPFEATLFGLGIYSDTGYFIYSMTTPRDFQAAEFLMQHGMNLEIIHRFSEEILYEQQQSLLNALLVHSSESEIDGLRIIVCTHQQPKFEGGLSTITRKLLETTGADAVITIVEMQKRIYIVCRASSNRIHFQPLLTDWGGGGHAQAGSATIKNAQLTDVHKQVVDQLALIIKPAITARLIMASPVRTIDPQMTIEEAGQYMYRYGHNGFPIEQDGKLLGIISRRDLDKANHHGLGHAPVKAYMTANVITIKPHTSLEEIQKNMIRYNIGRLPVLENDKIVGIVTRSDVIEILHNENTKESLLQMAESQAKNNVSSHLQKQLTEPLLSLLQEIGTMGSQYGTSVYLIGGMVRDILLERDNEDVDLTVEGSGIVFAQQLSEHLGGEVITHEDFGTATWTHPTGLKIDVASSRHEYYDHPAALPSVETSTLKGDLYRRDFTINAMAIRLNADRFGELIDPFHGQADLERKYVRVLHNLSFVEDPTRILRAIRFELRFGFVMDEQTEQLALASTDQLRVLSAVRISHELDKLFEETSPTHAMKRLHHFQFWNSLGVEIGDLSIVTAHAEQLEMLVYDNYGNDVISQKVGWNGFAYFILPFYHSQQWEEVKKFALTKKDSKLLQELSELNQLQDWQVTQTIGGLHSIFKPFSTRSLLFYAAGCDLENRELLLPYIQKRDSLPTFLTGNDLIQHGLKPGSSFATILMELEIAVLNGTITSREQALEWLEQSKAL